MTIRHCQLKINYFYSETPKAPLNFVVSYQKRKVLQISQNPSGFNHLLTKLHIFEQNIAATWPWAKWKSYKVLVAVSGGADSVALALALRNIAIAAGDAATNLHWVHVNHEARDSATTDQQFVESLAEQLGVVCHSQRFDAKSLDCSQIGLESAMRNQRYGLFEKIAHEVGARFVVTGHHRDDQIETVVQRIFRGTGLAGLRGIPQTRNLTEAVTVVRPLLAISKQEILQYLSDHDQRYCFDETNEDVSFKRNQIRQTILPFLREQFDNDIDQAIFQLSESAADYEEFMIKMIEPLMEKYVQWDDNGFSIGLDWIAATDRFIVRKLLVECWKAKSWPMRDMSKSHWQKVVELCDSDEIHKLEFPGKITAETRDGRLHLRRAHLGSKSQPDA